MVVLGGCDLSLSTSYRWWPTNNGYIPAVHLMWFLILELYYLMVEEQSGRKNLVGVQKFITTNMSQDRSQIWFKLPPLHDNLVFFVSELVSRPLQDVSVAFNRFFLYIIFNLRRVIRNNCSSYPRWVASGGRWSRCRARWRSVSSSWPASGTGWTGTSASSSADTGTQVQTRTSNCVVRLVEKCWARYILWNYFRPWFEQNRLRL